jgi:hypothetical protein
MLGCAFGMMTIDGSLIMFSLDSLTILSDDFIVLIASCWIKLCGLDDVNYYELSLLVHG